MICLPLSPSRERANRAQHERGEGVGGAMSPLTLPPLRGSLPLPQGERG